MNTTKSHAAVAAIAVAVIAAFPPAAQAEPAVEVLSVAQRWPFSRLVDVTYTLSGAASAIDIDVSLTSNGKTVAVPDAALTGKARSVSNGGPYRLTFDPTRTEFSGEEMLSDCVVTLSPTVEKLFMLVNLDDSLGDTAERVSYTNQVIGTGTQWDDLYKTNYIVLRRIPAGTFTMGRASSPGSGFGHETPQHDVTLTRDFYMAVYETTIAQFAKINGSFPISSTDNYFTDKDPLRPAHCVRYATLRGEAWDATNDLATARDCGSGNFLAQLRAKTGGAFPFDLPTEAQWEYACRAGTAGDYYTGENMTAFADIDAKLATLARYRYNGGYPDNGATVPSTSASATEGGPARVGSLAPNNWGLYDMLGNVAEWCLDWYGGSLGSEPAVDPMGAAMPESNPKRIVKGGSWSGTAKLCRTSYRTSLITLEKGNGMGFRLCLTFE
ncbi:MAG: formylglycine-generating enzyme family protein [Kiritimatiellae bacterium]|nr:formylglycine-generating enzyme family protein [Kiritimatiellia bacterium]